MPKLKLTDQIATRERSLDFISLGMVLPNPDPILKARGEDLRVYRELRSDAHIGGCIRRRKSAVKALDWGLDRGQAKSRVAREIERIFADLDLDRIIGEILEAPFYGYQALEISWAKVGALVVPVDLVAKPQEWFCYDTANQLRFKTREQPYEGEALPGRKFIVARQDATYANPYGFPDLSMCFWPLIFKKGGVRFWTSFAEKYGTPWAIGKMPRGTPQADMDSMADRLEAMIQDAVAVIPDDGSIELVEAAGKSASADLYERLVMYCRSEVSIALTGTNQTVESNSNRASATAGLEVAADIRDGDAGIVAAALNQLIRWTCDINWGNGARPLFSLWDQASQDVMQAERDQKIVEAGARLTTRYFMRAYNFQEGDLAAPVVPPGPASPASPIVAPPAANFAQHDNAAPTWRDVAAGTLAEAAAPAWRALLDQVRAHVDNATSLPALRDSLLAEFGNLPVDRLAQVMQAAFAAAELAGMADVKDESAA